MIGPERAMPILRAGGYLERRDERLRKRTPRYVTRLFDKDGRDLGVASYTRKRLERLSRIKEVRGPNNEQRWIIK